MSEEISYYKYLCDNVMFKTRGCRFSAASALIAKERFSIITIAFLSIYMLSWSIISLTYPEIFTSSHSRFYNAISAIAAVSLLVISLMDYSIGRSVSAEKLHANALRISKLMRSLERELNKETPDAVTMRQIAKEYEDEISDTQINHSSTDYRRYIYGTRKSDRKLANFGYWLWSNVYNIYYYSRSLLIHIALILIVVASTLMYLIQILKFNFV